MATRHDRDGGTIRPSLVAPGPRRRQRRLLPDSVIPAHAGIQGGEGLPSAGRAGSGFPRTDGRVARWGPRNTSHTVQPGPSRAVGYPWTRICRSRFVARERRRRELESKPVIDTVQITNRLTTGEGHVVRHGDVRRVRKVIVDCPASRTLRGQPPAHSSSRYVHRTETVRNRLIRKPTTKPLPKPKAEAQTQEPKNRKNQERPKGPTKRA